MFGNVSSRYRGPIVFFNTPDYTVVVFGEMRMQLWSVSYHINTHLIIITNLVFETARVPDKISFNFSLETFNNSSGVSESLSLNRACCCYFMHSIQCQSKMDF